MDRFGHRGQYWKRVTSNGGKDDCFDGRLTKIKTPILRVK